MDSTTPSNSILQKKQPSWKTALQKTFGEYGYLLIAALIPAVLFYLIYLAKGLYPFGDGTVLVLDLNGQYVSFYEGLYDILHGEADLLYSFSRNLGGEFLGKYDHRPVLDRAVGHRHLVCGAAPDHGVGLLQVLQRAAHGQGRTARSA